jgi:hypothetical protein
MTFGSSTFAGLTTYTYLKSHRDSRQTLVSSMVMPFPFAYVNPPPSAITLMEQVFVWALRLGAHLVSRMHREGRDKRFDKVKGSPGVFFFYWFMQARPARRPSLHASSDRRRGAAGRVDRRDAPARAAAQYRPAGRRRLGSARRLRHLAGRHRPSPHILHTSHPTPLTPHTSPPRRAPREPARGAAARRALGCGPAEGRYSCCGLWLAICRPRAGGGCGARAGGGSGARCV